MRPKTIVVFGLIALLTEPLWAAEEAITVPFGTWLSSTDGVKIISPGYDEVLTTLHPEFEWEKAPGKKTTYDFRIFFLMPEGEKPITLYVKEGLKTNKFKPDFKFKPSTLYGWSVRSVKKKKKSDWAYFMKKKEFIIGAQKTKRIPRYTTPAQ